MSKFEKQVPKIKELMGLAKQKGLIKDGVEAFKIYPPKKEGYFREEKQNGKISDLG